MVEMWEYVTFCCRGKCGRFVLCLLCLTKGVWLNGRLGERLSHDGLVLIGHEVLSQNVPSMGWQSYSGRSVTLWQKWSNCYTVINSPFYEEKTLRCMNNLSTVGRSVKVVNCQADKVSHLLIDMGLSVAGLNCHWKRLNGRRFIWGRNVAWLVWRWADHQGTKRHAHSRRTWKFKNIKIFSTFYISPSLYIAAHWSDSNVPHVTSLILFSFLQISDLSRPKLGTPNHSQQSR